MQLVGTSARPQLNCIWILTVELTAQLCCERNIFLSSIPISVVGCGLTDAKGVWAATAATARAVWKSISMSVFRFNFNFLAGHNTVASSNIEYSVRFKGAVRRTF